MKSKSYIVFGMGSFGLSVARTLYSLGYDVMVVDKSEDTINEASSISTHAVVGDVTDEKFIKSLGINNFSAVVVAIGEEMQASILLTVILKDLGAKYVLVKAHNELHAKVLAKMGADRIISPEKEMGIRVANNLVSNSILEHIELSENYSIMEIMPPEGWLDKSIKNINIRAKYGISIMAIKVGDEIIVSPSPDYIIKKDAQLVVIGIIDNIRRVCGC